MIYNLQTLYSVYRTGLSLIILEKTCQQSKLFQDCLSLLPVQSDKEQFKVWRRLKLVLRILPVDEIYVIRYQTGAQL